MVLIMLNIAIIHDFNVSIQRKKTLRASRFILRTSSKLLPKATSKFFNSSGSEVRRNHIFTVEDHDPSPAPRKVKWKPETTETDVTKVKSGQQQVRRMSLKTTKKEKHVIAILVTITAMFTIVNIPSGMTRILDAMVPASRGNLMFQVS